MAHVSAINAPSDVYGAVSDVSRPLVYKLNQASMQRSTYNSLHALLSWALAELDGQLLAALDTHEGHNGIKAVAAIPVEPAVIVPPQTPANEIYHIDVRASVPSEVKPATETRSMTLADATPLTLDSVAETPAELAAEAEVAAIEATISPVVEPVKATRVTKPK